MTRVKTHYDNLQVSRTAAPEVIAAAYRTISFKYHPDRNGSDPRSARIMTIVNHSYTVLSNPAKRQAHDDWIRRTEAGAHPKSRSADASAGEYQSNERLTVAGPIEAHVRRYGVFYAVMALFGFGLLLPDSEPSPSRLPPYDATPGKLDVAAQAGDDLTLDELEAALVAMEGNTAFPTEERKADATLDFDFSTAPNGSQWPEAAGYVAGYERLRTDGLSNVTIDNGSNSSDKFVKLVEISANKTSPIRHVFIPAYQSYTIENIRAGRYDVRFMDLTDGSLSRSESFELEQVEEPGGTRYSHITMTLYKVSNGNMKTFPLSASEF